MEQTQENRFHVVRDIILFIVAVSVGLLLLWIFIPDSITTGRAVIPLHETLRHFITTLLDMVDGLLCTIIFAAFTYRHFLLRKGTSILIGASFFFTGLLLTFNFLLFFEKVEIRDQTYLWFLNHTYFTSTLAIALALSIYSKNKIRVYTGTFSLSFLLLFFFGWIAVLAVSIYTTIIPFPLFTDDFYLYFNSFEVIPLCIFLVVCVPLEIIYFIRERTYASYTLLLSALPLGIAYVLNVLLPNENYFHNTSLYGIFELLAITMVTIGISADNFTVYGLLKKMKEQADLLSNSKSNFISSFSSQLRIPLDETLGLAEALEEGTDGPLNEKQKNTVTNIKEAANSLLHQIEEIIDISRIESGKITYDLSQFSISQMCKSTTELLLAEAKKKNIELKCELPENDLSILSDEYRVKQALLHLLRNAITYTEKGYVLLKAEETHDQIILSVVDTGKGIDKDKLSIIFEPYLNMNEEFGEHKLGIGLSIVRLIANALDAKLDVQSEQGIGTTFTLKLSKGK